MAFIFKPVSQEAAVATRAAARKLAIALRGRRSTRTMVFDGYLLHAIGDGKNVTVRALEAPPMLGFLVGGGTAIHRSNPNDQVLFAHMLDAAQALPVSPKTLCHPPNGFQPIALAPKLSGTQREIMTINERSVVFGRYDDTRVQGRPGRQFRAFTTPAAVLSACFKYRYPNYNNPWREPLLAISRMNAGSIKMGTGSYGPASSLASAHYLEIDLHGLGIISSDPMEIIGVTEWGKHDGVALISDNYVDHLLIRYSVEEIKSPPESATEVIKHVGRILWWWRLPGDYTYSPVGPLVADAGNPAADKSLYYFAVEQSSPGTGRIRTYLSKMYRVDSSGLSFEIFSKEHKIDTEPFPAVVISGESNEYVQGFSVCANEDGAEDSARFVVIRRTEDDFRVSIYSTDGSEVNVSIAGMYPVNRGDAALDYSSYYMPHRQRSPICQYAPGFAAILVSPSRQETPAPGDLVDLHVAVIRVETGAVVAVSPALTQYHPLDGLVLTTVEEAEVVDGEITKHAKMLLSRVRINTWSYRVFWKPLFDSEVFMVDGATGATLIATCPHPVSAYYLGSALKPARIGHSTGIRGLLNPPADLDD